MKKTFQRFCFKMGISLPAWYILYAVIGYKPCSYYEAVLVGFFSFCCIEMVMWGYKGYKD